MNYITAYNKFEVSLSRNDEGLLIETEHQLSGDVYSKVINEETAKALTTGQLFDTDTIFQLLKDFFENKPSNVDVTIADYGDIKYTCQTPFGNVIREVSFAIHLDKQEAQPNTKMEKLVKRLSLKVVELEKALQESEDGFKKDLKRITETNDERFNAFEKLVFERLDKIEQRLAANSISEQAKAFGCTFNSKGNFSKHFEITNDNKSAKLKDNNGSYPIFCEKPLPPLQKSSFSLVIEGTNVSLGIAASNALEDQQIYRNSDSFLYNFNATIWKNGKGDATNLKKYSKGDKLSVVADMEVGQIAVSINNEHVCVHTFSKEQIEKFQFYPYLLVENSKGSGGSFV